MTPRRLRAGLLAASLCVAAGCQTAAPAARPQVEGAEGARLEAVIDSVREALNEAQANNVAGFPPLKSVTIKLQTAASRTAGGGVDFLVFSLGSKYSAEETSTLELQMEPPPTKSFESLAPGPGVRQALAQAIALAKVGVLKASKGKPPLVMKSISIDLKFAVEVSGSGGASVVLVPLGIEAAGKISREKVQTLRLVFGS